ncbi:hypothetical protein GCM10023116_12480 [Kistimonas scapharcae]|uniref:Uncharacterized protein n=1 Tax=Kistimonas scapharcae TaxID=1036133 RepID=A0ABP8V0J1_9GAMM
MRQQYLYVHKDAPKDLYFTPEDRRFLIAKSKTDIHPVFKKAAAKAVELMFNKPNKGV